MSVIETLDNIKHRELRVITERGEQYGDKQNVIPVLVTELSVLVPEYPVVVLKDQKTGQFGLHVVCGFNKDENLFLENDVWHAHYVPLNIQRQPFAIATVEGSDTLAIDTENPRLSDVRGERLFDDKGDVTPFLNHVNNTLSHFNHGQQDTINFINALTENALLMPLKLDVRFGPDHVTRFEGFFGIDEEKLEEIPGDLLAQFHEKRYLKACYMLLASLGQLQKLIDWKRHEMQQ